MEQSMDNKMDNKQNISRRKFLQTCGSFIAGGSILGVTCVLLHKRFGQEAPTEQTYCSVCKINCSLRYCPLRKGITI